MPEIAIATMAADSAAPRSVPDSLAMRRLSREIPVRFRGSPGGLGQPSSQWYYGLSNPV